MGNTPCIIGYDGEYNPRCILLSSTSTILYRIFMISAGTEAMCAELGHFTGSSIKVWYLNNFVIFSRRFLCQVQVIK